MEWLLLTIILALLWFWWDGVGAKEIAVRAGKQLCRQSDVMFLDDSVALSRLWLRRNRLGAMTFNRRFIFEFYTDGAQRYIGYVDMAGKVVKQTYMQAYRLTDNSSE